MGYFFVLLAALLGGSTTAVILAVRGFGAVRKNRGNPRQDWLRMAALLAGSGAVSVYVWGILHVTWAVMEAEDGGTDSSPLIPCREAGVPIIDHVRGYDVDFVPLRFQCQLDDGSAYTTSAVPAYVNPAAALLGLTAVICGRLAADRATSTTGGQD